MLWVRGQPSTHRFIKNSIPFLQVVGASISMIRNHPLSSKPRRVNSSVSSVRNGTERVLATSIIATWRCNAMTYALYCLLYNALYKALIYHDIMYQHWIKFISYRCPDEAGDKKRTGRYKESDPHTAPRGAMVHDAFPPFPPTPKKKGIFRFPHFILSLKIYGQI